MSKLLLLLLLLALALVVSLWLRNRSPSSELPPPSEPEAVRRIALARKNASSAIEEHFQKAQVAYPPHELFLRAFKHEAILEVWARADEAPFRLVTSYKIVKASGLPGPKRREGDLQV